MLAGLNPFSAEFATHLFAAQPWLEEHAHLDPHPGADEGALRILYSPPPVREHCELWISTSDGEVTIGFGMFHTHFDWPPYDDDHEPLAFLAGLLEDRTLIEDWTLDGKWSGSTTLARGEEPDLAKMEPEHVVHVRSWSGALDRTYRP